MRSTLREIRLTALTAPLVGRLQIDWTLIPGKKVRVTPCRLDSVRRGFLRVLEKLIRRYWKDDTKIKSIEK